MTPDQVAAISTFLDALDEWGCEDNDERAEQIAAFIAGGFDLSEYLERPPLRVIPGGKEP